MHFFKYFFVVTSLSIALNAEAQQLNVECLAEHAVVINAETGAVLYAKKAEEVCFPASITKIATALYALKKKGDSLDAVIKASQEALSSVAYKERCSPNPKHPPYRLEPGGTHMGIKVGEELPLRILFQGLMLSSAGDASNVIAEYVSGTIPAFIKEMNEYLRSIGCKQTTFYNPHGLAYTEHKTTALDMATITREALKDPFFRGVVKLARYVRPKTNMQEEVILGQSNKLLLRGPFYYPKAIGVKTGYTERSGKTLVAAAEENGRTLIAVLIGYTDPTQRFKDAIALFEAAFNETLEQRTLFTEKHDVFSLALTGAKNILEAKLEADVKISYYPTEESPFKTYLHWNVPSLPIQKGTHVGDVEVVTIHGKSLAKVPLIVAGDVEMTLTARFWEYADHLTNALIHTCSRNGVYLMTLLSLASFIYLLSCLRRKKNSQGSETEQ